MGAVATMVERPTVAAALAAAGLKDVSRFQGLEMPYFLMPHQIVSLNRALAFPQFGLFNEARTGKTPIFLLCALYVAKYGLKTVILVPPILFDQIEEEWGGITGPSKPGLRVLRESKAKREALFEAWSKVGSWPDVLVTTTALFRKYGKLFRAFYSQLVFDESHMGLQNIENQTYEQVAAFTFRKNARLVLSTGTPIPNDPTGVYPTLTLINPLAYISKRDFNNKHVIFKEIMISRNKRRFIPDRFINLGELHKNLYEHGVRYTKKQVLKTKEPNIQILPISLSSGHLRFYQKFLKERVLEVGGELINATQAQKLRQVALQLITTPEAFTDAKPPHNTIYDAVEEIMNSVMGQKVVVFANFNASVEGLCKQFEKYKPARVYGPDPAAKTAAEVKRFQNDPECLMLVANPVAGGVGITLGHVSQTVVFVEPVSTPGAFEQSMSRIILKGQEEPVSCYILKIRNTISPKAIKLMLRKGSVVAETNRDKNSVLASLLGQEEED